MAIPPTIRLFPELRSDLRAAGFTSRTLNIYFRDIGRMREFVQFQRDRYSTPQHVGVLVNVAAVDLCLWAQWRAVSGNEWMPELPESPDYGELDSRALGWRDRPEPDFMYFDSEASDEGVGTRVCALLADALTMLELRRVAKWTPPRPPSTGLP